MDPIAGKFNHIKRNTERMVAELGGGESAAAGA